MNILGDVGVIPPIQVVGEYSILGVSHPHLMNSRVKVLKDPIWVKAFDGPQGRLPAILELCILFGDVRRRGQYPGQINLGILSDIARFALKCVCVGVQARDPDGEAGCESAVVGGGGGGYWEVAMISEAGSLSGF